MWWGGRKVCHSNWFVAVPPLFLPALAPLFIVGRKGGEGRLGARNGAATVPRTVRAQCIPPHPAVKSTVRLYGRQAKVQNAPQKRGADGIPHFGSTVVST